jgi:hypothetical protein
MKSDRTSPLSIENLLQLKRAERPPAEFWNEFDKELRAKQLVAIMERRPWWASWQRILPGVVRHPVPTGAAAALILSFLGFQHLHSSAARVGVSAPASGQKAPAAATERSAAPAAVEVAAAPPPSSQLPAAAPALAASASVQAGAAAQNEAGATSERVDPLAALAEAAGFAPASSLRLVAVNFAVTPMDSPEAARILFGQPPAFVAGNHFQAMRVPVLDPLARMSPPSNERRARILAEVVPAAAAVGDSTSELSDRLIRRLSDERLDESISRYGASADRFSVKF